MQNRRMKIFIHVLFTVITLSACTSKPMPPRVNEPIVQTSYLPSFKQVNNEASISSKRIPYPSKQPTSSSAVKIETPTVLTNNGSGNASSSSTGSSNTSSASNSSVNTSSINNVSVNNSSKSISSQNASVTQTNNASTISSPASSLNTTSQNKPSTIKRLPPPSSQTLSASSAPVPDHYPVASGQTTVSTAGAGQADNIVSTPENTSAVKQTSSTVNQTSSTGLTNTAASANKTSTVTTASSTANSHTSNAVSTTTQQTISPNTIISRDFTFSNMNNIVISGPMNILVQGNQLENRIQVTGTVDELNDFSSIQQPNGTLVIGYGNKLLPLGNNHPVQLVLSIADPIQSLSYKGDGQLQMNNVGYQNMTIQLGGNSITKMRGNSLVLSRITVTDNALLHAYWINSSNLHIVALNNARVFLGGIVTNLDIFASGNADVDAKYLRADDSFIKTMDNADVGAYVKQALGSVSAGKSTIYYYRDSEVGQHYLASSGSALRMKGISDNTDQSSY